ncbi:MAG: hypothetical protein ACK4PI_12170 [Tepidisphaerales bacterium]
MKRKRGEAIWLAVLWPLGVVTLAVIVLWTGWITASTLSVWWNRLLGG